MSTWKAIRPEIKEGDTRATGRDGMNILLAGPLGILAAWVLHDLIGLDVKPEVAIAIGTVGGYFIARKFRY